MPMETVTPSQDGWALRCLKFFTPKRLHKYYTPEAVVAWNVSSWITIGQVTLLQKCWPWIAAKFSLLITASKTVGTKAKDVIESAIDAVLI